MTLLPAALAAAQRSWRVFPAEVLGKRPHGGLGPHWGPLPTTDLGQVATWWAKWPAANVAVACKPSGLLVIDCDPPKNEGDPDGLDEYTEMWERLRLPAGQMFDTYTVRTPRGGLHFYYAWPPGYLAKGAKLAGTVNVDIRCNGSEWGNYVLAAGSAVGYRMDCGSLTVGTYEVEHDRPPTACPPALGHAVANPPQRDSGRPARPVSGPVNDADRLLMGGSTKGMLDWLASVQPGNQDNALAWVTRALRDEGVERSEAADQLWDVVSAWPTAGSAWTWNDVERHCRSAYK